MRQELENHLSPLRREGTITLWHHGKVRAGGMNGKEVDAHLHSAHIILLLISSDFLASDNCYKEMVLAMERYQAGQAHVIPIVLRPVDWVQPYPLQVVPTDAKPITLWRNRDEAFTHIARAIRKVVEELH